MKSAHSGAIRHAARYRIITQNSYETLTSTALNSAWYSSRDDTHSVWFAVHPTTNGSQSWIHQCQRANFTFRRRESWFSSNDNGIEQLQFPLSSDRNVDA